RARSARDQDGLGDPTMTATRPTTLEEALAELERDDERIFQLEAEVARFRMLAEGVPNHLLFLDRDLKIQFANQVFLEAAGWSAEDARGRHICDVVGMEKFVIRKPYYERALAGETVTYE